MPEDILGLYLVYWTTFHAVSLVLSLSIRLIYIMTLLYTLPTYNPFELIQFYIDNY